MESSQDSLTSYFIDPHMAEGQNSQVPVPNAFATWYPPEENKDSTTYQNTTTQTEKPKQKRNPLKEQERQLEEYINNHPKLIELSELKKKIEPCINSKKNKPPPKAVIKALAYLLDQHCQSTQLYKEQKGDVFSSFKNLFERKSVFLDYFLAYHYQNFEPIINPNDVQIQEVQPKYWKIKVYNQTIYAKYDDSGTKNKRNYFYYDENDQKVNLFDGRYSRGQIEHDLESMNEFDQFVDLLTNQTMEYF